VQASNNYLGLFHDRI